jgi:hypothetical protein
MSDKKFSFLLFAITKNLVEYISVQYKISVANAMEKLYNSKTYSVLENRDTRLWQFSKLFLFLVFDNEQKTGKFEISASSTYNLFKENGIFEALHTLDTGFVISEIEDFLHSHNAHKQANFT